MALDDWVEEEDRLGVGQIVIKVGRTDEEFSLFVPDESIVVKE